MSGVRNRLVRASAAVPNSDHSRAIVFARIGLDSGMISGFFDGVLSDRLSKRISYPSNTTISLDLGI